MMLIDEFLPAFDVSDEVATVVAADVPTTWKALMEADLIEVGRRGRPWRCWERCGCSQTWCGRGCTASIRRTRRDPDAG